MTLKGRLGEARQLLDRLAEFRHLGPQRGRLVGELALRRFDAAEAAVPHNHRHVPS